MAQPSLIVVPSRFKAGTLYAYSPLQTAPVSFGVTRGTTATRINSAGLIESVASGVPRLDYGAGACPGLLVEPAATNLVLRSEEFDDAYWTKTQTTATANQGVAPDGTTTAELFYPTTSGTNRLIQRAKTGLTNGIPYTQSFFVKSAGFRWAIVDGINGISGAWFDLQDGVVGTVTAGNTAAIQSFGNGWYRCSVTRTAVSTSGFVVVRLADANNSTTATTDGTNGLLIWGAQLETGSVATSYIPTVAATATRNADVISLTNASGFIGQSEGTVYAEVDLRDGVRNTIAGNGILEISTSTTDRTNGVTFIKNTTVNGLLIAIRTNNVNAIIQASTVNYVNGINKLALAYQSGNTVFYVNGVQSLTISTAFTFTGAINAVNLGFYETNYLNDRINAAAIYPTRLSNDELAQLTSL